jgi:hypothetical protein
MTKALDELIRERARHRCEYCLLPQDVHQWKFEIDHIIAEQHGGQTENENLALCCPRCNRFKGTNIASLDPDARVLVRLFNPRIDAWSEHFEIAAGAIVGKTAIGRATAALLQFNEPVRLAARTALILEGRLTI